MDIFQLQLDFITEAFGIQKTCERTIHYNSLKFITIHYNSLQFITIHYNSLQFQGAVKQFQCGFIWLTLILSTQICSRDFLGRWALIGVGQRPVKMKLWTREGALSNYRGILLFFSVVRDMASPTCG